MGRNVRFAEGGAVFKRRVMFKFRATCLAAEECRTSGGDQIDHATS